MGVTSWKKAPRGKNLKSDVAVARNYLAEDEVKASERIVSMYLDYAEDQAARRRPMRMANWALKLDGFLRFNVYDVLGDAGRVSREVAKGLAEGEYDAFGVLQDATSNARRSECSGKTGRPTQSHERPRCSRTGALDVSLRFGRPLPGACAERQGRHSTYLTFRA